MARAAKTTATEGNFSFGATPVVAKKSNGKVRKRIEMKGVEAVAAVHVLLGAAAAIDAALKDSLKTGPMTEYFVREGCLIKSQPENVDGFEGQHTASLQLRKRGGNMALSDEEIALLTEHNVPMTKVPAPLQINSEYMPGGEKYDAKIVAKLEKAIGDLIAKGDVPMDIIVRSGAEKTITTDETLPAIFRLGDNAARMLLPVASVMSIGTKFNIIDDDITPALDIAAKVMALPGLRETLLGAAKDPDKAIRPPSKSSKKKA